MAKMKVDENQLDLFAQAPVEAKVEAEPVAPAVEIIKPITESTVMVDGGLSKGLTVGALEKLQKSMEANKSVVDEKPTVNEDIQSFLKSKEEPAQAEVKQFVEIAGQVKMDAITFSQSIPDENRFVSLSLHSDMVIITPIPEDGSLNLKAMKDNYPTFITQVQRVTEDSIPDPIANLEFLDKLRTIVEGKLKAGKQFDSKEVEAEMAFISKIDQGDVDFDADEVSTEEPSVEKQEVKAKKLKM